MNHPFLQQIKEQTHESHKNLEKNLLLSYLLSNQLDINIYLKILMKFYGFFAPLEKEINKFEEINVHLPDYPNRRKAKLLLNDISNINKESSSILQIDPCEDLPGISVASEAFGCLYVMEGSTLGGRMIYKSIEKQLQISNKNGASFFYGYGTETSEKWKSFQSGFSSFIEENPEEVHSTIRSAVDTFEKLKIWLNQ